MAETGTRLRTKTVTRTAKPPLHKVILVNDDFTTHEVVVRLLNSHSRVPAPQAAVTRLTAHTRGSWLVAVFTTELAEEKANRATEIARNQGYPLLFTTEAGDLPVLEIPI